MQTIEMIEDNRPLYREVDKYYLEYNEVDELWYVYFGTKVIASYCDKEMAEEHFEDFIDEQ